MKARWLSLIVVLLLVNYLIISTIWHFWGRHQTTEPTPTRTPCATFTPEGVVRVFMTSTSTPRPATVTSTPAPTGTPVLTAIPTVAALAEPTDTPNPPEEVAPEPVTATPESRADHMIHQVAPGDMLILIASRYNVDVDRIVQANGLRDTNFIYVGQELIIPVTPTPEPVPGVPTATQTMTPTPPPITRSFIHVVVAGESLDMISTRYGVTSAAIVETNGLRTADMIYVGQRLIIPTTVPPPTPSTGPASRSHVVRAGETLTSIATRYGLAIEEVMRANSIANPDTIYVGQVLVIP